MEGRDYSRGGVVLLVSVQDQLKCYKVTFLMNMLIDGQSFKKIV